MACDKCGSERIMSVGGKCGDRCSITFKGVEKNGYMPYGCGIGGGDYIEFQYCLECGKIQGEFPKPDPEE